ncbi:MAG: SpoIIIAH-like family protein [Bacillota bacterium]|nr:SpoIIIAH-like family protein [Bacillota bacterium]MDW7683183.1 SpoIIIAH-like family protein [Bacillota bacterium]
MNASKRMITLVVLLVTVVAVYWLVEVNREMIDIVSPDDPYVPSIVNDPEPDPENWDIDQFKAFFVEYRLQRDRVRATEKEMLNEMINNENVSPEAKREAEEQILDLVELMEDELMVENMLKAHGYKDAVFFFKDGMVNVVVQSEALGEQEFMQIAEMVSSVTGVTMDRITVVEHNNR